MRKYYNYIYLDPRKPGYYSYEGLSLSFLFEPFYVGKGCRSRLYEHLSEANSRKRSLKISKIKAIIRENFDLKSYIIQINQFLSSKEACDIEVKMIKIIGRISLKTGPLTNMTDGGEGLNNPSPETRKLLSFPGSSNPQSLAYLISHGKSESEAKTYLREKMKNAHLMNPLRGKTYVEVYGEEKAAELKLSRGEIFRNNYLSGKHDMSGAKNPFSRENILKRGKPLNRRSTKGESTKPKHTYTVSFPDGSSHEIFGYLKSDVKRFCDEQGLSWTTLSKAVNRGPISFEDYSKNVQSRLMNNPKCFHCLGISVRSS